VTAPGQSPAALGELDPACRPLGLVLGAGGARGFAHIGALKVLRQAGLPIDLVVGTSMGGLVGAAVAAGLTAEVMEHECLQAPLRRLLLRPSLRRPGGLLDTTALEAFLERLFGRRRIEELELPFAVMAINLRTLQTEVFRSGPLVPAIMAGIAIPLVFPPRRLGDDYYVDGGLLDGLPTSVARAMGARTVVAIDADVHGLHLLRDTPLGILARSVLRTLIRTPRGSPTRRWILLRLVELTAGARRAPPRADVLIRPTYGRMTANDFHRGGHSITLGEAAAREALPRLQALRAPEGPPNCRREHLAGEATRGWAHGRHGEDGGGA
jgi:NTE family protein